MVIGFGICIATFLVSSSCVAFFNLRLRWYVSRIRIALGCSVFISSPHNPVASNYAYFPCISLSPPLICGIHLLSWRATPCFKGPFHVCSRKRGRREIPTACLALDSPKATAAHCSRLLWCYKLESRTATRTDMLICTAEDGRTFRNQITLYEVAG